ncbi:MAG: 3-dehydroquinate synthase [Bacteroidetes bacterium]|nr:3-dehydroquinate synthase [Bacteroidota bacterium]
MQLVNYNLALLSDCIQDIHPSSVLVLLDSNTDLYCYPLVRGFLPEHNVIVIPAGEENKNLQSCDAIWRKLTDARADRNALVINLGGGMITDLGGFASACYKRGLSFINIPTSLLAMVDASVGAKTGIDFLGFKNQIGAFKSAEQVFVYTAFLDTLPKRELVSGMAEVVKHYLIADKDSFFEWNESMTSGSAFDWQSLVQKSIVIKQAIVDKDPLETGDRKALNFGHTIGHAVETFFLRNGAGYLLHGEAVAIGMICEAYISWVQSLLTEKELQMVVSVLKKLFILPALDENQYQELLQLMQQDKKNEAGELRFTLLNGIGNYSIHQSVEEGVIIDAFNFYNRLLS